MAKKNSITTAQLEWVGMNADATEGVRADESARARTRHLDLLARTSAILIAGGKTEAELLQTVFDTVAETLDTELFFNFLVAGDRLRLATSGGLSDAAKNLFAEIRFGQYLCGTVAEKRLKLVVEDLQHCVFSEAGALRAAGVTCYGGFPLLAHGHLVGTVAFATKSRTHFRAGELQLIQTVCDQVSITLERERLLERERNLREEAEKANRLKDEFLATVSHELRTPLNAIVGWASIARRDGAPAETVRRSLEVIERNARNQSQLINDILDVSRIITGKFRLDLQPLRLSRIVGMTIDTVRPSLEARRLDLRTTLETDTEPVFDGDGDRLQQIVWNLLSNAIKFTPTGGAIDVSLEYEDQCAEVIVRDTGQGIEPDFLPYVFERFRQADGSTTRRHGGLGLGLAVVRHLAEMHGGQVSVESEGLGCGATFTVRLPLRIQRAEGHGDDSRETTRSERQSARQPLKGVTLLVVDDEPDALELVRLILSDSGAVVVTAESVGEALGRVENQRPDAIVSDIGMPEADGFMLAAEIRSRYDGTIPTIALTAYVGEADTRRALESGFAAFLPKPLQANLLLDTIARVVRQPEPSRD